MWPCGMGVVRGGCIESKKVSFPPVVTAVRFEGDLTESQGRALSWMREREREDDARRWVEEEAEEAVVKGREGGSGVLENAGYYWRDWGERRCGFFFI